MPVMAALWDEDREAGHVRIVAQVIAGSANRPELSSRVVELMEPWNELARQTLERVLPPGLPAAELGYAIVVWYLGANLIAYLDPGGSRLEALFAEARRWTPLLEPLLTAESVAAAGAAPALPARRDIDERGDVVDLRLREDGCIGEHLRRVLLRRGLRHHRRPALADRGDDLRLGQQDRVQVGADRSPRSRRPSACGRARRW